MRIIRNTTEFHIAEPAAVAIGKFDGIHRGHRRLLEQLRRQQEKGLAAVVFTFVPSPASFFSGEPEVELTTLAEKRRLFAEAGVDYLIEYPFYREIADMEPETYIREVLVERINARCIVAGDDVSYGRGGAGDCRLLEEKAALYGYEVMIIDKVLHEGREISSTYVREAVKRGDMELAAALLGAPYLIVGEIVHGQRFGRTIGMPTVNLQPPRGKLLPPNGVYYSRVRLSGREYPAITNIGTKPTVADRAVTGVETYIYDFDREVYGEEQEVFLLRHTRPERRFDGVEALKTQLASDIAAGRRYHFGTGEGRT
ncbi:MAG: bifunctional riboflavin kinase/FAD synthetase [Roseburia sp.]|nr:bifunctional riboflavin kinase/FAD synthetase [Roseburia sp.]